MKRYAPATARNSEPIAAVLQQELPESGTILEVASGSGEHAVFLARRFPQLIWQPSDCEQDALASIAEWSVEARLGNILAPIALDASASWPESQADAIFCCNMIHISPWSATEGLFRGAMGVLGTDAPLILYGPFLEDEVETAPSNAAFDQSLRSRNPEWGIRHVQALDAAAEASGFIRTSRYAMPANNLTLVYRKI